MKKILVLGRIIFITLLAGWLVGCIRPEPPAANTALCTPMNLRECVPSPDGQWTAEINGDKGTLLHNAATGLVQELFPPDNSSTKLSWSPDSRRLVIVRNNWSIDSAGMMQTDGLPQLWQVAIDAMHVSLPTVAFDTAQTLPTLRDIGPGEIRLSDWSPDGRHLLFWVGPVGASIQADGLPFLALDTTTKQATFLADPALLNPRYHSWAPDGSALAYTAGGYRSAQVNKWLNLWDSNTGQVSTVITATEQIPGIVAWSPQGDWLAYAAVSASETSPEWADLMTFDNPAIAGRRIYLLNPTTGAHRRLNERDSFQDAPVWRGDGATLYYVQRDGAEVVLMATDPVTGQATPLEASRQPLPDYIGYYGQGEWEQWLTHRPSAQR